jgi:holo-[acyl-carrier protein] synthase
MRAGIDAQPVADVLAALAANGDRYRRRIYTEQEVASCGGWGSETLAAAEGLAARFAAKEAVLKVLRVTDVVPPYTDIEVVREDGGWTSLRLTGVARQLADAAGLTGFEVSLSHTSETGIAIVIAQ